MMYSLSRIEIDDGVAEKVSALFKTLDRKRGGLAGTWHSPRMRSNPYPWFETTFNRVQSQLADYRIDEWWFNCMENQDEYRWHEHVPYPWVAVLYVQATEETSAIEFRNQGEHQIFHPKSGDLLLFPGNRVHRVLRNQSKNYRISVGFNLNGK